MEVKEGSLEWELEGKYMTEESVLYKYIHKEEEEECRNCRGRGLLGFEGCTG